MLIEYLPLAVSDLSDMADYYRTIGGKALARRMMSSVSAEILVLRDFPEMSPAYELVPGVRRMVVANGAFLVFYRLRDTIEILHVRRSERIPATEQDMK